MRLSLWFCLEDFVGFTLNIALRRFQGRCLWILDCHGNLSDAEIAELIDTLIRKEIEYKTVGGNTQMFFRGRMY